MLAPADVDTAVELARAASQCKHCGKAVNIILRNKCPPSVPLGRNVFYWSPLSAPCSLLSVERVCSWGSPRISQETRVSLPAPCFMQGRRACRKRALKIWPRWFLHWWIVLVPSLSSGLLVPCARVCFWFNAVLRMSCIPRLQCGKKGKYVISTSWNLQGERRDQA